MTTLAFDTLKVSKDLRELGFDDKQAEGLSSLLNDVVVSDLATKEDLEREIGLLRQDLSSEIKDVRSEIKNSSDKLTIRIGGMIVLAVAVIEALGRFA